MSLPNGYKRLEYIKSTGTQYIDTGFKHNQNTRVVMHVKPVSIKANAWVFEGRISYESAAKGVFYYYSGGSLWCADYKGMVNRKSFSGISSTANLTIDYNKNVCTINGVSVTNTAETFQSTANLTLLACNTAGTISGFLSAKLYYCKIYDNDVLIRDFVPCINASGEVGLWDDVNSVFYVNAGTGTFTAGPVKEPPPAPATLQHLLAVRLAWSAVDGATKYNVYRDDVLLTSTTETTYIDLTAAENTEYVYAVSAVGSGGESAKTAMTVYTKSGYFLYKPYIESATFQ